MNSSKTVLLIMGAVFLRLFEMLAVYATCALLIIWHYDWNVLTYFYASLAMLLVLSLDVFCSKKLFFRKGVTLFAYMFLDTIIITLLYCRYVWLLFQGPVINMDGSLSSVIWPFLFSSFLLLIIYAVRTRLFCAKLKIIKAAGHN